MDRPDLAGEAEEPPLAGRGLRICASYDGGHRIGKGDDRLGVHRIPAAPEDRFAAENAPRGGVLRGDGAASGQPPASLGERQRSICGISDLCLEIHRALPVGATPADITDVAMMAISGTAGAEVVQVSRAPDLMDVSSLGIRDSDGQSILRLPNTMRWAALSHLNLEECSSSPTRTGQASATSYGPGRTPRRSTPQGSRWPTVMCFASRAAPTARYECAARSKAAGPTRSCYPSGTSPTTASWPTPATPTSPRAGPPAPPTCSSPGRSTAAPCTSG
jgi:hypothetical protein